MNITKDYTLEDLAAFHGHLGPYIVLGYRIGRYVRNNVCNDPFQLTATVYCSGIPPQSCIVDGVQLGSGCTLGKRTIDIIESNEIKCEFTAAGRCIKVFPRPIPIPHQDRNYHARIEEIARELFALGDEELFSVVHTEIRGTGAWEHTAHQ
jgi:formylmethanofuran dehydrogenase subunit E